MAGRLEPLRDDPGARRAIRHIPATLGLLGSLRRGLEDPATARLLGRLPRVGFYTSNKEVWGRVSFE